MFFIYVKYQVNQPLCPLNQTVPTRPCVQPRIVIITPGWIYGVGYMVKDHSDNERGIMSPPLHGLLFLINKGFLYAPSHRQNSTYHGFCGKLAGTRNSSMGPSHHKRTLYHGARTCCIVVFEDTSYVCQYVAGNLVNAFFP